MTDQSESLLDQADAPDGAGQPADQQSAAESQPGGEASNESSWFLAEKIAGQGDAPEWFKADKYKTVADQAKAYPELEKRFGGFTGAPEDGYKLEAPEGMEVLEGAEGHPRIQLFMEVAKDENMSQAAFNRVVHRMMTAEQQEMQETQAAELKALGESAGQRLQDISTFYAKNLTEDQYQAVRELASTAAGVEALENLMQMAKGASKLPVNAGVPSSPKTGNDLKQSVDWEKYAKDPVYRRQVSAQFVDAFGNAPANSIVG